MTIRQIKRLVAVLFTLFGVVALVCVGVLFSPLAKSPGQKEADLRNLQQQFKEKQRELAPSIGMDKKIASATENIAAFFKERLPGQYSQIDESLNKAAKESGVELQNVTFKPDKKTMQDLQRVDISIKISGPYVSDVKFINAMERNHVFFVINSVSLAGSTNGVQLDVRAETYFRTGAA